MTELTLFHFPGACSQVCLYGLEEAELPFKVTLVDIASDEQTGPDYLAISPLGKVPALRAEGQIIAENAAILTYIAALQPEARLFPRSNGPLELSRRHAGLSFCGGTLHPIVRGIAVPSRMTDGDIEPVRSMATKLAKTSFGYADHKIAEDGWWLGEPSIVDAYLNWAVRTAARGGFDFSPFPALAQLHERLLQRPAYARMIEKEAAYGAELEKRRSVAP